MIVEMAMIAIISAVMMMIHVLSGFGSVLGGSLGVVAGGVFDVEGVGCVGLGVFVLVWRMLYWINISWLVMSFLKCSSIGVTLKFAFIVGTDSGSSIWLSSSV